MAFEWQVLMYNEGEVLVLHQQKQSNVVLLFRNESTEAMVSMRNTHIVYAGCPLINSKSHLEQVYERMNTHFNNLSQRYIQ
jgi:hypothetical protein